MVTLTSKVTASVYVTRDGTDGKVHLVTMWGDNRVDVDLTDAMAASLLKELVGVLRKGSDGPVGIQ